MYNDTMKIFEDLLWRGLVKQVTSPEVEHLINRGGVNFYCGFDPTADSLHIGSLMPLITMKRLQMAGNNPICLLGGFTGSIGDPSFKSQERKLLEQEVILSNSKKIEANVRQIINCEFVNNLEWFKDMNLADFLRTVGKHITVNEMLGKDSVKTRLDEREQGISFTEFSYMLFQGFDFVHLCKTKGVTLQVAGSDQFGNIVIGTSLARKMLGKEVFGLTSPLITKSDGTKFGKTESGNIWLDPNKTSPFDFFQFFFNVADADVINLLKFLTFLDKDQILKLEENLLNSPELRLPQKALATELTKIVHGEEVLKEVLEKTESLFKKKDVSAMPVDLKISKTDIGNKTLISLLVELGLSASKTMARKDIEGKGISINEVKILDISKTLVESDFISGKCLIQKGKSNKKVVEVV